MNKRFFKSISKKLNNKRGSGLITVIYIMVIVVIFVTSIGTMFSNNLKQIVVQEKNMEAYYLSLSGIDIAMSALMQEDEDDDTLLGLQFNPANSNTISKNDTLTVDTGDIDVSITSSIKDSVRWVKIVSIGKLNGGRGNNTTILEFQADNPEVQRWN